ncbi:MAG: branched-chain amino acid ABC transporter permease [Deltaproteobacteria bacterium]|nr:branched-chain amino acid ABC transporter permease [Deltaproteobacteria bacterium]
MKKILSQSRFLLLTFCLLLILFLLFPKFLSSYHIYLLCEVMVTSLLAYAFFFMLAYGGLINFGISAYYGVGAYTVAILLTNGITRGFWLSFFSGMAMAALLAVIIGWLCARRKGIYFALLTLAFSETVHAIIFKWRTLTGGDDGIPNVPRPPVDLVFVEVGLKSINNFYYLILIILLITLLLIWVLANSNFGYTLRCIRDNPERASFIGLNVQREVWIAFIISGIIAGLAGGLRAILGEIANPDLVSWMSAFEVLLALMIGGINAFTGPFFGTLIYVFLKSYLISLWGNWLIVMGILLILSVMIFRSGVMGFISEKLRRPL